MGKRPHIGSSPYLLYCVMIDLFLVWGSDIKCEFEFTTAIRWPTHSIDIYFYFNVKCDRVVFIPYLSFCHEWLVVVVFLRICQMQLTHSPFVILADYNEGINAIAHGETNSIENVFFCFKRLCSNLCHFHNSFNVLRKSETINIYNVINCKYNLNSIQTHKQSDSIYNERSHTIHFCKQLWTDMNFVCSVPALLRISHECCWYSCAQHIHTHVFIFACFCLAQKTIFNRVNDECKVGHFWYV